MDVTESILLQQSSRSCTIYYHEYLSVDLYICFSGRQRHTSIKFSSLMFTFIDLLILTVCQYGVIQCLEVRCLRILHVYFYILFSLVWFYGISTIVGYLMPNPVFRYILDIWFVNTFCRYTQLNYLTDLFWTIQFNKSQQS